MVSKPGMLEGGTGEMSEKNVQIICFAVGLLGGQLVAALISDKVFALLDRLEGWWKNRNKK